MKATSKLLTLLALILLSSISAISINAENRFYIDDFTISSGETKELAINLTNDVAFTGFQADIYLPEGLEVEQEDGEYIFDLTDRKGRDHTLSAERQNNGAIRILSYSLKLKEFSGTSGALVNFRVTASDDFSGNYQIQIKNITFATADQAGVDFESTVCNVVGKCLAESITLNVTEASLQVNGTTTLTATVLPETATNKSVTWTSSNEAVATVNANGVVTAIALGEAIITATTTDGSNLTASCKVTVVTTLAESITLNVTEASLKVNETTTLTATVLPETATNKSVTWTSSDEEIAVVNEYGVVTAIALGEAVITATTTDGSDLSASCKVTVVPVLAMSIELDKTELDAMEMTEFQLTATVLPENTTNKGVVWSSSDNEIASVDETGLVKMLRVGSVVITATTVDGSNLSASCHITIVVGIDDVEGDNVIVATIGDNIVVKNAKLGSNVIVYAADGRIISSEVATDGDVVAEAPAKGIYVVVVDDKSFKVMVK